MAQVLTQRGAFIGGEWLPGDGEEIEVRSPASGELLGSVRAATPEQVDQAVAAAAAAFETWRRTSVLERVEICRRGYDICMDRAEEIARMITRETGKTIRESREEMVEYTADHFRRAAEDVLRHAGQVLPSTQGRTHKRIIVIQEPVGVVAAISPWNFPVDIAGIPIVYGLAFGCTTVWKPSELAPLCAELFVDVLHEAGFPAGTVNLVHGRGDVGATLTGHRDVASVVFTGSVATGEKVAREAGLKNRILELGGNGPQIVLADANLEAAADAAVMGCFYLAGQVCTAAERVLVHSDVHDRFVELLVEKTKAAAHRRPARRGHRHGPDVQRGHARAHPAPHRGRRRARRGRRPRRRARTACTTSRRSSPASRARWRSRRRRRSGRSRRSCASTRSRRRSRSATRPSSGSPPPSSRTRSTMRGRPPRSSATAPCTSTRRRTTGIRWRRSAAPRARARAASWPSGIADAVTETKQITFDWS